MHACYYVENYIMANRADDFVSQNIVIDRKSFTSASKARFR